MLTMDQTGAEIARLIEEFGDRVFAARMRREYWANHCKVKKSFATDRAYAEACAAKAGVGSGS